MRFHEAMLQVRWISMCKCPSGQGIRTSVSGDLMRRFISDDLNSFLTTESMYLWVKDRKET